MWWLKALTALFGWVPEIIRATSAAARKKREQEARLKREKESAKARAHAAAKKRKASKVKKIAGD